MMPGDPIVIQLYPSGLRIGRIADGQYVVIDEAKTYLQVAAILKAGTIDEVLVFVRDALSR